MARTTQSIQQQYLQKVIVFRNRYPFLGPIFWLLSVQYFIIQGIVAAAWTTPFSLMKNAISDLGNTACGPYSDRYVCSPLHSVMNISFIIVGVTIMLGSLLIPEEFRKNTASRIGFYFMGLAGVGTVIVGLSPENTIGWLHLAGAVLPFLLGNVALILFNFSLDLPPMFQYYTLTSGIVALIAFVLFGLKQFLGFGLGGIERLTAYPQTIWLMLFGLYTSVNRYRQRLSRT